MKMGKMGKGNGKMRKIEKNDTGKGEMRYVRGKRLTKAEEICLTQKVFFFCHFFKKL